MAKYCKINHPSGHTENSTWKRDLGLKALWLLLRWHGTCVIVPYRNMNRFVKVLSSLLLPLRLGFKKKHIMRQGAVIAAANDNNTERLWWRLFISQDVQVCVSKFSELVAVVVAAAAAAVVVVVVAP